MKTIKDYIQFAIDNGYRNWRCEEWGRFELSTNRFNDICISIPGWNTRVNIETIITSKYFIEKIARGLLDEAKINAFGSETTYSELSDMLCALQAIAIRDWKLEEFIEKLFLKEDNE